MHNYDKERCLRQLVLSQIACRAIDHLTVLVALNNVLAESSSDADGSAVVRVHVPPLAAVTVPVAL